MVEIKKVKQKHYIYLKNLIRIKPKPCWTNLGLIDYTNDTIWFARRHNWDTKRNILKTLEQQFSQNWMEVNDFIDFGFFFQIHLKQVPLDHDFILQTIRFIFETWTVTYWLHTKKSSKIDTTKSLYNLKVYLKSKHKH